MSLFVVPDYTFSLVRDHGPIFVYIYNNVYTVRVGNYFNCLRTILVHSK